MILEGWRDAIWSGLYTVVRYDCASESVAHRITRLAKKVGLTGAELMAEVQANAEQIAAVSRATAVDETAVAIPSRADESEPLREEQSDTEPAHAAQSSANASIEPCEPQPALTSEAPMTAEECERLYRDVFGTEPAPRRRWRR